MSVHDESTPSAVPASENVSEKSDAQLQEVIDRCRRLLGQPLILARLPGKEQELRTKLATYEQELQTRTVSVVKTSANNERATTNESGATTSVAQNSYEDYDAFQRLMGDKYRNYRPDLEEEMRKSLSTLSNNEIQRRLDDIPNPSTYLMTYGETLTMERESRARERQRELNRLRQRREASVKEEAAAARVMESHPAHRGLEAQVFGQEQQ